MKFLSILFYLFLLIHKFICEEHFYHLKLSRIISEGIKEYKNQNWQDAISYFESALSYNLVLRNRTNKCMTEYGIKSSKCEFDLCLMPKYKVIYEEIMYYHFMSQCLGRSLRSGEYFEGTAYNTRHSEDQENILYGGVLYDYLFYCYYKIDKNEESLSALRTYSYYSPNSQIVSKNLDFISKRADSSNVPSRSEFFEFNLYINGNKAYNEQKWESAVEYFEQCLASLTLNIYSCKLACTDSPANLTKILEFPSQVKTNHDMKILECMLRCHDSNILIGNHINLYSVVLELLHYSQYRLELTGDALKSAYTFRFINPNDTSVDKYIDHYQIVLEVYGNNSIRKEIEHVYNQKSIIEKLLSILKDSHKSQELFNFESSYSNRLFEDIKLYSHENSFKNAYLINSTIKLQDKRIVLEGLASKDECAALVSLASIVGRHGDGYSDKPHGVNSSPHTSYENFVGVSVNLAVHSYEQGLVDKNLVMLYLEIAERSRHFVETYFQLNSTLYFDYTHLVCRSAKKDKNHKSRKDLSHPVHADNCILKNNGDCERIPPAYTSRDYSALVYLSEDFEGGDFFFANRKTLKPDHIIKTNKCGRMSGFSAGAENLHGVLPVKKGKRCAIALWFTLDESYREDRTQVYQRLSDV